MSYQNAVPYESDSDLSGLGFLNRISSESELEERFKKLVRGAAINVIKREGLTTLEAISEADYELGDEIFQDDIEHELVNGLAGGDLIPLDEKQFQRELSRQLKTELSDLGVGEIGWNPFKSIKKIARKAKKKIVRARKKVYSYTKKRASAVQRGAKRAARNLGKGAKKAFKAVVKAHKFVAIGIYKKVGKAVAKVVKDNLPLIKKVAIIAAVGAALYFGGPLVIAALKTAGPALLAKAKSLGPIAAKVMKKLGIGKGEITDPNDPRLVEANAEMQREILAQQGVNMDSPEAQQLLLDNGKYQQNKLTGGSGFPIKTAAMIGIPVIAAFMLMG